MNRKHLAGNVEQQASFAIPICCCGSFQAVDESCEHGNHLGMPKRKEPELTPAEQKKRFEELAREVGAKHSSEQFRKTLKETLSMQRKGKQSLKRR